MKAVVFIDVQKDFIDGALKNEDAIKAYPKIVEFAKECMKDHGYGPGFDYKFYATRDTHEATVWKYAKDFKVGPEALEKGVIDENTKIPMSGYRATLEGVKLPVEHCVEGTDGWEIKPELMDVLLGHCTFINKPTFGSFDLAELIDEDAVKATTIHNNVMSATHLMKKTVLDEIIICGFCTDICVISNALILRAKFPNTKITIMKDLCAGVTKTSHEDALAVASMCQIDVK